MSFLGSAFLEAPFLALGLGPGVKVGPALEAERALAPAIAEVAGYGAAASREGALARQATVNLAPGAAGEWDRARALAAGSPVGRAQEGNRALAPTARVTAGYGPAAERDLARPLTLRPRPATRRRPKPPEPSQRPAQVSNGRRLPAVSTARRFGGGGR